MNEDDPTETIARLVVDILMGIGGMIAGAFAFWSSMHYYMLRDWVSWASWQTYLLIGYLAAGGAAGVGVAEYRRSRTLSRGTRSGSRSRRRSASSAGWSTSDTVTRWLRQRGWKLGAAMALGAFGGWVAMQRHGYVPDWPYWVAGSAVFFGFAYWVRMRLGYDW